jgi:hypothetical protein
MTAARTAVLHRLVTPEHTCPFGPKAIDFLNRKGFQLDHRLVDRRQTDAVKTVLIDRRELKCACVGGDSKVPLGFVSLTEHLMMVAMAIWMLLKPAGMAIGVGH